MIALRLAAYFVTAWIAAGAFFYFDQTKLLFPAPKTYPNASPSALGLSFEDLRIAGSHAWWIPSSSDARTAIVFHGNGYVLEDMVGTELSFLRELGLNLLLVDYRGYGRSSPVSPNESTVFEDADASLSYLVDMRNIPLDRIFVLGRSIGSGPAVYLAAKAPTVAGLILESPFSSIDDAAQGIGLLCIYPVHLMLRTHFDNYSRIGSVHAPVIIVTGAADTLTPPWMARKLFDRAHHPKTIRLINGAGHNDLIETGASQLRPALLTYLSGSVNK